MYKPIAVLLLALASCTEDPHTETNADRVSIFNSDHDGDTGKVVRCRYLDGSTIVYLRVGSYMVAGDTVTWGHEGKEIDCVIEP